LLSEHPDAPVAIVESEKSAIIASIVLHGSGYVWLATGSMTNLKIERLKHLENRKVYIFADRDAAQGWQDKITEMHKQSWQPTIQINNFVEQHQGEPHDDIADILVRYIKGIYPKDALMRICNGEMQPDEIIYMVGREPPREQTDADKLQCYMDSNPAAAKFIQTFKLHLNAPIIELNAAI
jgi:hypothetical protein